MVAALVPSLLFLGHWSIEVPLPGGWHAALGATEAPHGEDQAAHAEHCHGESSCSDTQPLGIGGFALMGRVLALLGAAGPMFAAATRRGPRLRGGVVAPEPMPPRLLLA
jgi:hypothetical protein